MTPPCGRRVRGARDPHQARRLGRDAVRRDELLLLADRRQEAERVRAEADDADGGHGGEARHGGRRDPGAAAEIPLGQHREGQHESRRQLHAHARREREGRPARARVRSGPEQERDRQRRQQQRVVVGAADRQHEQHRVQSEEGGRECRRAPEPPRGAGREADGREAREGQERFERPQRAGEAERSDRVAREREERPVGRVLERPADEAEDRVGGGFGREAGVRVEAVQRPHPRERDIAEDVLGDQGRAQCEDQVGGEDGRRDPAQPQGARGRKRGHVGAADDQHQRLEAAAAERRPDARQGPREPARPAAAVRGHVPGGARGGVADEHGQRREQHERRERPGEPRRRQHARRLSLGGLRGGWRRRVRRWPGGTHEPILTASPPAGVHPAL